MERLETPCILFVCTGNYYRSRFAEVYFNHLAEREKLAARADSRGFQPNAENIGAISPHVPKYLEKLQIEIPDNFRFPIKLLNSDFDKFDRIIALDEREHLPMVEAFFPDGKTKLEFWQIADVPLLTPETALPMIENKVRELIKEFRQIKATANSCASK